MQPDSERPLQIPNPDFDQSDEPVRGPMAPPSHSDSLSQDEVPGGHSDELPPNPEYLQPVHWQAAEYFQRERNHSWFAVMALVAVALTLVAIFVIKSLTFAVLIPVMTATLIIYSYRPPRMLSYSLGRKGLHINDQLFPFSEFKGFSIRSTNGQYMAMLVPVKRFKPAISVNLPNEVGEVVVDMLASRLPVLSSEPDIVDRIIEKLHL